MNEETYEEEIHVSQNDMYEVYQDLNRGIEYVTLSLDDLK